MLFLLKTLFKQNISQNATFTISHFITITACAWLLCYDNCVILYSIYL